MKLNICCSDSHAAGYWNVDRVPPADQIVDLDRGWLWQDSSIEEIRAWDAFEHLRYPIHSMNEAWRVLVPGGKLDLIVPTTDGRGAWQDPGHISYWNPNSLWYFCEDHPCWQRFHAAYGIAARFRLVESTHAIDGPASNMIWKLRAILEAIK